GPRHRPEDSYAGSPAKPPMHSERKLRQGRLYGESAAGEVRPSTRKEISHSAPAHGINDIAIGCVVAAEAALYPQPSHAQGLPLCSATVAQAMASAPHSATAKSGRTIGHSSCQKTSAERTTNVATAAAEMRRKTSRNARTETSSPIRWALRWTT